jgi:protein-tyrosine phosphatase
MQRWFGKGYILQLNKGSILGAFGTRAENAANDLLKRGLAHVIASDAHHADFRTTHMSAVHAWGREYLGPEYCDILLRHNPMQILMGKEIIPPR